MSKTETVRTVPLEIITSQSNVLIGMTPKQYEASTNFLNGIAKSVRCSFFGRRVIYFLDDTRKQKVYAYPELRGVEVFDNVDTDVMNYVKAISSIVEGGQ